MDGYTYYVSACWGSLPSGEIVSNYREREHEDETDAAARVAANRRYLESCGYKFDSERVDGGATIYSYKHPELNDVRETGYWGIRGRTYGASNPGHCEAAYLMTE